MSQRFAVVRHETPQPEDSHFDLFFEMAEALFSLKIKEWPESLECFECRRQFDHRKKYLDYQGPISQNRGTVRLWDQGVMTGQVKPEGAFELWLGGQRLCGRFVFEPLGDELWRVRRGDD